MPLQNRVDPYGRLQAIAARGAWMGNRGILHDDARKIVAPWRLKRWITCVLSFNGRKREVFAPHHYSELFFLDEATSFAAGHRPCAECRRERYNEFRTAWSETISDGTVKQRVGADEMDHVLHTERVIRGGGKRTWQAALAELPSGTMIEHDGHPHLIRSGQLWPWSFTGYRAPVRIDAAARQVTVLTPQSIVRVFNTGFMPQVHASADG